MRTAFRHYIKKAGLNDVYYTVPATGGQCGGNVKERKLHRLSTHSLRHSYITNVYKTSKDPIRTKRLARHKSFSSTEFYIGMCEEDDRAVLEDCFNGGQTETPQEIGLEAGSEEFAEFWKFYKMWKSMR